MHILCTQLKHLTTPESSFVLVKHKELLCIQVYTMLHQLGARFYITHDIIPVSSINLVAMLFDEKQQNNPPLTSIIQVPAFTTRGLQPFHDFPMGPDFWSADFYKFTSTQMAKLKMNLWGFHTYPVGGPTEPAVWVGTTEGFTNNTDGSISDFAAYPSSWYLSQNFSRGNLPGSVSRATSEYCCGAASLFPRDCYGSDAQEGICFPQTPSQSAQVFDATAKLLGDAFSWASSSGGGGGVDACVGTEIPLTLPPLPYLANATLQDAYEGIFSRLVAAGVNASCYWLWTTEAVEDHSTGKGYPQNNPLWDQLTTEIEFAIAARNKVSPNLQIGTNGWCLGPGDNSSFFDKVINDPTFTLSSIDPILGWGQVDPGFANVTNHRGFVIPWMEDDMGLIGAELWVNRTLSHAADAQSYNASGLLGILWRTWETSPQITALAAAGWGNLSTSSPPPLLTAYDVYFDFCAANFGLDTADTCANLFLEVDGSHDPMSTDMSTSKLPRGGQGCCGGPLSPRGEEGPIVFLNTSGFEQWLPTVTGGPANIERATRWVNLFLYHQTLAWVSTAGQELQQAIAQVHDEFTAREYGFPVLTQLSNAYTFLMTLLLSFTTTPGELGMLVANEGMNWPSNFFAIAGPLLPYITECVPYNDPTASCYADPIDNRVFPYTVTLDSPQNTREWCAGACRQAGYSLAGVEFGVACFCGNELPSGPPLPIEQCRNMTCAGDPSEYCGGPILLSVYSSACPPAEGGGALPPNLFPPTTFIGDNARIFSLAPRTTVGEEEGNLTVEVTILSATAPESVELTWWTVSSSSVSANTTINMTGIRGVYSSEGIQLPSDTADVLEYVVEALWTTPTSLSLFFPVEGAQSVVIV